MPDDTTQRILSPMTRGARGFGRQPWTHAETAHRVAWIAFLVWYAVALALLVLRAQSPEGWSWRHGLVLLLAGLGMLTSLVRRLPLQNVGALALIILSTSAVAVAYAAKMTDPSHGFAFTASFGPSLLVSDEKALLPWQVPLLWLALTLSSRETARLVLRPWRRGKRYGLGLLALAAGLVLVADLALEPFAVQVGKWWTWPPDAEAVAWYAAPWSHFAVWLVLSVLLLAFVTPWYVVKRPLSQAPDFLPLGLWLLLVLYFTVGNALAGLWPAVAVGLVSGGVVGVMGWRGWRSAFPAVPPASASAGSVG